MDGEKDAHPTPAETAHDGLRGARHDVAALRGELHRAVGRMAALQEGVIILRDRTDGLRRAIRDVREDDALRRRPTRREGAS